MKLFIFDENYNISLNKEEILLINEFADLWDIKRNKSKDDPTCKNRFKAFAEFKFIYLVYDWQSPYKEFSEKERVDAAIIDSNLSMNDLKDPLLKKACRKYIELQDTKILKMLRSAYMMIDKLRMFYETLDLTERDPETNKYIYDHKSAIQALGGLDKAIETITRLEDRVRHEMEEKSAIKGDAIVGLFDTAK